MDIDWHSTIKVWHVIIRKWRQYRYTQTFPRRICERCALWQTGCLCTWCRPSTDIFGQGDPVRTRGRIWTRGLYPPYVSIQQQRNNTSYQCKSVCMSLFPLLMSSFHHRSIVSNTSSSLIHMYIYRRYKANELSVEAGTGILIRVPTPKYRSLLINGCLDQSLDPR